MPELPDVLVYVETIAARVVDAGAGIQLHAQDVCDVDLGLDAV